MTKNEVSDKLFGQLWLGMRISWIVSGLTFILTASNFFWVTFVAMIVFAPTFGADVVITLFWIFTRKTNLMSTRGHLDQPCRKHLFSTETFRYCPECGWSSRRIKQWKAKK